MPPHERVLDGTQQFGLVEGLLEPVYNFNPNGWMLFRLVGRLLGSCCFSCITADGWRALCRIEQPRARRTLLRYRLLSAMPR